MYLAHAEGLLLFFVIKMIPHTQLGSCFLPQKDNTDLLIQPLYDPAHHTCSFPSAQKSFSDIVRVYQGRQLKLSTVIDLRTSVTTRGQTQAVKRSGMISLFQLPA